MARTSLLLKLLLASQLVLFVVAVPSTRLQTSHQAEDFLPNRLVNNEEATPEGNIINGKMDLEMDDYHESGPNNRHNPRSPSRN